MAQNSGGPWGGGGNDGRGPGGTDEPRRPQRPRRTGDGPQIPEIDDLMNRGREQLRVLMGGGRGPGGTGGPGGGGPKVTRGTVGIGILAVALLWAFMSFYTVEPDEQSVELFLGDFSSIGDSGLNFAPWPVVTYDIVEVTSERSEQIGASTRSTNEEGLMLTTDENIVDIGFQVVWNVSDPARYLFNIAEPQETVVAVSESVMREVIAASNLAPILNRDRGIITDQVREGIQATLDDYDSGIRVVRVNLDRADPPSQVIDAFREVQAAEQERDRLQREADRYANRVLAEARGEAAQTIEQAEAYRYANRVLAEARGEAAQTIEQAEAYRAQTVNDAVGQASRFRAVLTEYLNAEDVTRRRIYLETMEEILADMDKLILDPSVAGGENGGSGVVPFLPLNEMIRGGSARPAAPAPAATGAEN